MFYTYWDFTYDVNGQRLSKTQTKSATADGARTTLHTTTYYYDGTKLVAEKKDGTIIWYDYDENGTPIGMRVNGEDYLFGRNLQGDIIAIYNESFQAVAHYTYDAWGKVLSVGGVMADTIGEYNSLRYRGYYYDSDTGLYYLNSRYYDPVMCRFVNADGYASTGQGIQGNNMYAYCQYNPINYVDKEGTLIGSLIALGMVTFGLLCLTADNPQTVQHQDELNMGEAREKYNASTVPILDTQPDDHAPTFGVVFNPNNTDNGQNNPSIHIHGSSRIQNKYEMKAVLEVVTQAPEFDPSIYLRDVDSYYKEWKGHNMFYNVLSFVDPTLRETYRAKHVDLDNSNNQEIVWDFITLWGTF